MKLHWMIAGAMLAGTFPLPRAHGQSLVAEYAFNETGTSAANSVGGGTAMTLNNASGAATDTHTAGVSGQAGDYAFDGHSYALGMGNASSANGSTTPGGGAYGVVAAGSSDFSGLSSFTITGWYDASSTIGNSARLFASQNVYVQFSGGGQGLNLTVNGVSNGPGTGTAYSTTNAWTFFAISYNSATSLAYFYIGSSAASVSYVGSATMTGAGAVTASTAALYFGNGGSTTTGTPYNDRPFDGSLDDFRIYSGTFGTAAAADTSLDAIRVQAVPEPASLSMLSLAGLLGAGWAWRRRFAAIG